MKSYAEMYRINRKKIEAPKSNCYISDCFVPIPKEQAPPPPPNSCFPICYSNDEYLKSQGMERISCDTVCAPPS
jgi:hypothetical protein